ncbi:ABC transporter ATP-binding protein [Nocardioides sp. Root151]|uniref:ABC transporter ATP-binding protein n=1 Tax=Nocardioides sp. Root151 TaxID=1736475 RepID=UPI00191116D9|nr:ABC transporter ATP-binding protein [Nocardioides sp. Root151]
MDESLAVATTGLTKAFGKRRALQDLDLEVPRGVVFGYLGPNGAGKTTTLKLLAGLYRPTSGRARIFGRDVTSDRDRVQRMIGYLPGDFTGYADQTGRQFLHLIASLRGGVDPAMVRRLAERFDVDLGRRLGTLSHGNRQKIGIIQAFMNQPPLLVLDEPTQGLDPLMQREFLALLGEVRGRGQTVLLSSHVLSEVEAVADRIAILKSGRLLTTLPMDDLHAGARRSIDLTFEHDVPEAELRHASGVRDVHVRDRTAHLTVTGSTADLVRVAAPYGVARITTHDTDLADTFLGFYENGSEDPDAQRLSEGPVGSAPQPSLLG